MRGGEVERVRGNRIAEAEAIYSRRPRRGRPTKAVGWWQGRETALSNVEAQPNVEAASRRFTMEANLLIPKRRDVASTLDLATHPTPKRRDVTSTLDLATHPTPKRRDVASTFAVLAASLRSSATIGGGGALRPCANALRPRLRGLLVDASLGISVAFLSQNFIRNSPDLFQRRELYQISRSFGNSLPRRLIAGGRGRTGAGGSARSRRGRCRGSRRRP